MKRSQAQARKERTIGAGEFKAKCLQLLDEVKEQQIRVVITKRGVPCATLIPHVELEKPFRSVIGRTPGGKTVGDIIAPLPEEWTTPAELLKR